jgi:hypothetical protein
VKSELKKLNRSWQSKNDLLSGPKSREKSTARFARSALKNHSEH